MTQVTVIGGGIAGLSAVEAARKRYENVTLYEADSYDSHRSGAWGELVRNFRTLPIDRSTDGVVRSIDKITVYTGSSSLTQCLDLHGQDFMIINRGDLETAWARDLAADPAVTIQADTTISPNEFDDLIANADLMIDASGPDPITGTQIEEINPPQRVVRTVSASGKGDFSQYYPVPAAIVSDRTKMFISTKQATQATYGVGWEEHRAPADMIRRFYDLCELAEVPLPSRSEIRIGTEPLVGSRPAEACAQTYQDTPVRLVGDAAGLVSMNRFGMNKAAATGQQAVRCFESRRSYASWLQHTHRRYRIQSQLLTRIEGLLGDQTMMEFLGKISDSHPVSRF